LAWAPKYRKWILRGDIREYVARCFKEIAVINESEIEAMEIAEDHCIYFWVFRHDIRYRM
jgi:putative transposase